MWNYRVIKSSKSFSECGEDGIEFYGLYETFYNDAGEICAHDEEPTIVGESVESIKKTLEMMMDDAEKHEVLDGDKIEFKEFDK